LASSLILLNQTFGNTGFNIEKIFGGAITGCLETNHKRLTNFTLSKLVQNSNNITINDKVAYCFFSNQTASGNPQDFQFKNTSTYNNTKFGQEFLYAYSGTQSARINGWYYPINQTDLYFGTGSLIQMYATETTTTAYTFGIGFINDLGEVIFHYEMSGDASGCTSSDVKQDVCFSSGNSYDHYLGENVKLRIRINDTFLQSTTNNTIFEDVVGFYIGYSGSSSDQSVKLYLDDIYIKVSNGSNLLPSFNVTFNRTNLCINGTQNKIVDIEIQAYDSESDTIYYAKDYRMDKNYNKTIKYSKSDFTGLGIVKDYSSFANQYNDGTYCQVQKDDNFNISKHNVLSYVYDSSDLFDKADYMLALDSVCSATNNEYIYKIDKSISNLFYYTELYGLIDNNEAFNLTFYSDDLEQLFRVRYEIDGTKTLIKYKNNTNQVLQLANYTTGTTETPIELSVNTYSNGTTMLFAFNNNNYYSIRRLNDGLVKYIGLSVEDGRIYQREFQLSGIASSLNFSVNPFNDFEVSRAGNYLLNYYVTDINHLNGGEYTYKSYNLYIPECKYFMSGVENTNDYGQIGRTFNLIAFLNTFFGVPFREYMSSVDTNNVLETILWWTYLVLFVGFAIGGLYLTGQLGLVIPLISSSAIMLILGLLSGLGSILISSIIGLVLGITIPLSSNIGGNNG